MGWRRVFAVGVTALGLAVVLTPARAWAPVPPRDCGMLEAGSKRYNVKADQLRCRTARRYAKSYLVRARVPSGYTCRNYGQETRIKFRCSKGVRVLFAIRR